VSNQERQANLMKAAEIVATDYKRRFFLENGKMIAVDEMKIENIHNDR
jgi:hypothetical protein